MFEYILPIMIGILSVAYYSLPFDLRVGDIQISSSLICLFFFSLCLILGIYLFKSILKFFLKLSSLYKRIFEVNPNSIIELVLKSYLGSKSSARITESNLNEDNKFLLNLIKFALGLDFSADLITKYPSGKFIVATREFQQMMKQGNYKEAIPFIENILRNYSITPFLYKNLRKCYLEAKEYNKLDYINSRIDGTYSKYFSKYGKTEGKIFKLIQEYNDAVDKNYKIAVLEKIFNSVDFENEYTYKYLQLLQELGRNREAMEAIEKLWSKSNSIVLGKVYYNLLKDEQPEEKYEFILKKNYPDSIGKDYLLCEILLENNNFEDAAKYAEQIVEKGNKLVGDIMMLKIYKKAGQIESISRILEDLQESIIV